MNGPCCALIKFSVIHKNENFQPRGTQKEIIRWYWKYQYRNFERQRLNEEQCENQEQLMSGTMESMVDSQCQINLIPICKVDNIKVTIYCCWASMNNFVHWHWAENFIFE